MTDIALKEYVEGLIRHERELREAWQTATAEALALQAKEYERRLQDLNHEAHRVLRVQEQSVSQDRFEGYITGHTNATNLVHDEFRARLAAVDIKFAEERGGRNRQAIIWGVIVTIITLLMKFVPPNFGLR
jgi:hypothetical protein